MIVHGLFLLLFVLIIPSNSLICYECGCAPTDLTACNCNTISDFDDNDYCTIFEQRYTDTTYIQLSRIPRNSTYIYIEDPYYILALESVRYNQTADNWYTWTNGILFGCDWDRCNSPDLIVALPNAFKLYMDPSWLTTNIYGTGSVTSCHHCPTETCGDETNPIDFSQCPMTACVNSSTCLAYDLWNDLHTGAQCYQSQCAPEYLDGETGQSAGGKYRIDVEAIIYLAKDRTKFDIWEIDVYCGAYNCSRPTIFQEIAGQLMEEITDLSMFPDRPVTSQGPPTTSTPIQNPLTCYKCECFDTTTCPCSSTIVTSLDQTYCIILRENLGQHVEVYLDYLGVDQTYMYVREFPYALVEESIGYDEQGGRWFTTTNFVIYGCNWNLCNKPELVPLLPDSFQMRLPEAWLNTSILGTGQPVRDCHECPDEIQCASTDFLDANTCPIQPCNNTCLVIDSFDDPAYDYLCYQSFCLSDIEGVEMEQHRIEIEGIIYASEPKVVELWEIDIYCRADNCSRPGIFKELHEQLYLQTGNLAALFNETHDPTIPQRRCYDCYCYNQPNCNCERTTIMPANISYCVLVRENFGQDVWITMEHINQDSTRVHIRDFPYLVVEESILYSEQTGRWNTIPNLIVYGCNWDYCNHPSLIPYLPNTFQMRLPETWLNTNVLGSGLPARNCHECPDAPQCGTSDFLDVSRCPIHECNTTCLVLDTFDDPANDLQCYQSFCISSDSDLLADNRHRVEMEGILYLHKQPREVELWEIDIFCRADDCSRPEIFSEIKSQFRTEIGDISIFDQQGPTTTGRPSVPQTTPTGPMTTPSRQTTIRPVTTPSPQTTIRPVTTPSPQTTTAIASIFASINLFHMLLISILLFYFH